MSFALSEVISWIEGSDMAEDQPINTDINIPILQRLNAKIKNTLYLTRHYPSDTDTN